MSVEVTRLPSGLVVVTDAMPHLQTASLGVWVGAGSRNEEAEEQGISHFLEHMAFKGTTRRSPRQILRRWVTVNLMIGALGRKVPLMRLRYEDLVADPAPLLREVLRLVDEPVTADSLAFVHDGAISTGRSHAAAGGRVRLERGRLELRPDERRLSWDNRKLRP